MVERDLAKVDVAGSTPVSRSRILSGSCSADGNLPLRNAEVLSRGAVPKW